MLKTLGGRLAMKRFEHTLQRCRVFFLKSAVLSTSFKGKHAKTLYCRTIYTSGKQPRSVKVSKNAGAYAYFALDVEVNLGPFWTARQAARGPEHAKSPETPETRRQIYIKIYKNLYIYIYIYV